MSQENLTILFEKYLSGTLTEEEFNALWQTLEQPEHNEKWTSLAAKIWQDKQFHQVADEETRKKIRSKLSPIVTEDQVPVVSLQSKRSWRAVAAAAVLLLGIGGYWFIQDAPQKTAPVISEGRPTNNIVPGANKAVLTLSNGHTVELDSAANGLLARQGQVEIIKRKSGEIVYNGAAQQALETTYNTITTPRGGQYKVTLPDGTEVWLNAASSITYPVGFAANERRVNITGEAYFEVAKDAKRPFRVSTGNAIVEVLGTHFNIMGYEDEVHKTTLLEGAVRITVGNKKTLLKPGQQASLYENRTIKLVNNADVEEVIAWKNGVFLFKSVDIETIMRQASRWYNVEVKYAKKCTASFSGDISRNADIMDFLAVMAETDKVKFDIEGHTILVTPL